MSAQDAAFLYFERSNAPLHIGSVAIFEGSVPFDRIRESLDSRMHLIPRYRQRPVFPPLYAAHPTWDDDPSFSVDRHVRLVELLRPGSAQQLTKLAGELFAPMLPRDRPLWSIDVIHGLEGDRTAYVSRVHHCMVDGVSGIELLLATLDLSPRWAPTPPPPQPWRPKAPPNPAQAWAEAVADQWNSSLRAATEFQTDMLNPRGQFRRLSDFGRALQVALPAAMTRATPAPWNGEISGRRCTAWTDVSFQEVRAIRSRLGGTVNDVVLTIIGGALGRYVAARGEPIRGRTVRLQIPVNVRAEDERGALGNRVSQMLPSIPLDITDPPARLRAVRAEMEQLKAQDEAGAFETLSRMIANTPAIYHALAGMRGIPAGLINLVCTNIPGPMIPLYSVGHRMLAHYPLVPLAADLGVGVGVTSYDNRLYFGIMADPTLVPDVDLIRQYLDEEFEALRAAVSEPPLAAPPPPTRTAPPPTDGRRLSARRQAPRKRPRPKTRATAAARARSRGPARPARARKPNAEGNGA